MVLALAGDGVGMKRLLALLLTLFIVLHAPWRLMGLGVEMFALHPGAPHFDMSATHYWDAAQLEDRLMALGWSVRYLPNINVYGQPAYGVTVSNEHAIAVDVALGWDARYAVLAHEAGHTQQPYWVNAIEGDCFAESVAALVAHDGLREHARYLASRRWTCAMVLVAEWRAIYHAASTLTD